MVRFRQEWDYPPRRRPRLYNDPLQNGWASPAVTSAANAYWKFATTVLRVIIGAICGLVLLGVVALIVFALKA